MDMQQMTDLLSGLTANQPSESSNQQTDLAPLIDMAMQAAPALLKSLSDNGMDLSGLLSLLPSDNTASSQESPAAIPNEHAANISAPVGIAPQKLPQGQFGSASNKKTQLLRALKPCLNPRRAKKIDRAVSMLDTAYAARAVLRIFTAEKH